MPRKFSSTTGTVDEATGRFEQTPILGAPYWNEGVKVSGTYVRSFTTSVGECHEFMTTRPIKVKLDEAGKVSAGGKEKEVNRFAMGALKGFEMALQRLDGFDGGSTAIR